MNEVAPAPMVAEGVSTFVQPCLPQVPGPDVRAGQINKEQALSSSDMIKFGAAQ
jgi:hypothetical protein